VSSRRDGDLDKAGREQYKSFMMTVAQQAGGQTPAAAAAASASAASSARADSSSKPQQKQQQKQPQYPSTASFVEAAAGVAASAEASSRGKAAIVGFFGDTAKFKLAGEKQRQQQARELQIAAVNLIKGCGDWELGIPAMAAGTPGCVKGYSHRMQYMINVHCCYIALQCCFFKAAAQRSIACLTCILHTFPCRLHPQCFSYVAPKP
jgi:hypothetical protein